MTAIRTAFTINTALRYLSLSSTSLTPAGAIALAEFLPDAPSLLHLDLTSNPQIDIAGVMALSTGLKVNRVMRCLDLDVIPGDPEMARLSREILRVCVRNTELVAHGAGALGFRSNDDDISRGRLGASSTTADVQYKTHQRQSTSSLSSTQDLDALFGPSVPRGGIWGLIERSELAKGVKQVVERERVGTMIGIQKSALKGEDKSGKARLEMWKKTPEELVRGARDLVSLSYSSRLGSFWARRLLRFCGVRGFHLS